MMLSKAVFLVSIGVMFLSQAILADTLVLKDGSVLQGTFKGATSDAVQFEVNGKVETVMLSNITTLTFSPREDKSAATAVQPVPAVSAAAPVAASGPVTVPAGSKLMLKTKDTISTASHKNGSKFTAVL